MPTLFEQYEYAKLAQAGYIDFSGVAYANGATVAQEANDQNLIPLALAQQVFNENSPEASGQPAWTILDAPNHNDAVTGFHAALFGRGSEKVLAIAGTEPKTDAYLDLWHAHIQEIGTLGVAIRQAVSLFNYVQRLIAPAGANNVLQLDLHHSPPPSSGEWDT